MREIDLPPPPEGGRPAFTAAGVVNAASPQAVSAFASGAFFTIYGTNLAPNSPASGTSWSGLFQGSSAPTSIDGVRVLVNGLPAFLNFVNDSQINAIAPDDSRTGDAVVRVVNSGGISDPVIVQRTAVSPALFTVTSNGVTYAATSGASYRPGDTSRSGGTGLDQRVQAVPAGQPCPRRRCFRMPRSPLEVSCDDTVCGPTEVGLYQFNVVVPEVFSGNQAIAIQVQGVSTPPGVFLSVQ